MPNDSASTISRPTIFVVHAPASVMALEENSNRFSFLLGHASVQTTERYIGCRQKLKEAVNDRFQILLAKTA